VLPPIIQHSSELRNKAADEIDAGQCPALTELASGYKLTRDKIRIAQRGLE